MFIFNLNFLPCRKFRATVSFLICRSVPNLLVSLQKCKSLHFPIKSVDIPNTDALTYMMYKGLRGHLADLKESLDETLEREFNKISDKGSSDKGFSGSV